MFALTRALGLAAAAFGQDVRAHPRPSLRGRRVAEGQTSRRGGDESLVARRLLRGRRRRGFGHRACAFPRKIDRKTTETNENKVKINRKLTDIH